MFDYGPLYQSLIDAGAQKWLNSLPNQIKSAFDPKQHSNLTSWLEIIQHLPTVDSTQLLFDNDTFRIVTDESLDNSRKLKLETELKKLHPWRKGPYDIFGIHIDTEWRSDWKWQRLKPHISKLNNKLVLDVGSGNGYHCWRMLGAGAKMVVGIDPTLLSVMQFHAIRQMTDTQSVFVLPLGIEALPKPMKVFDSVFSMGILYHRRSPIDHLYELRDCLRPGGELILETLVIQGKLGDTLVPEGRYAKMRNVWFIPSCETLKSWLLRCGYSNIRLVNVNQTRFEEQRSTPWMQFHSLQDFLLPNDHNLTIEGHPAPLRAIFIANSN